MSRVRIGILIAMVLALAAGGAVFYRPTVEQVCAHTVALHGRAPTEEIKDTQSCRAVLAAQEQRDPPWVFAAQMRCYVNATTPAAFHDCNGELSHFGEL
jgi:hypothetical protein